MGRYAPQTPRRRKVRFVPFPPCGENCTRSLAPPLPTKTASLGFRGDPKVIPRQSQTPASHLFGSTEPKSLHRKEVRVIAICHVPIKIIQRSKGKSAVAAAAYRSGTKLTNEWDGLTHDYTHKGGVVHAEIMLPVHAPPEFADRSTLWNSVEQIEESEGQPARPRGGSGLTP